MKTKIFLKRILHRDRCRILLSFRYDPVLTGRVRQIKGCLYSGTHKGWYVDDNENNLKQILQFLKDDADIDLSELTHASPVQTVPEVRAVTEPPEKDSQKSYPGDAIPESDCKKSVIIDSNDELIPANRTIRKVVGRERFDPVEFRINEEDGRLSVRFTGFYDKSWIDEIRSFGRFVYDETNKEFLLPWSVMTGDSLSDYFASQGVAVNIIKAVPSPIVKNARRELGDEIRNRVLGERAIDSLEIMRRYLDGVRYSNRTNESYISLLEFFFKYFHERDPLEIPMEEVSGFVYDFIILNGYSASYQNQMISAIKTFYRISGRSRVELEIIERPRRSRALPKVFSKEEVKRILNSTRNTKHKLILWMIYSCGLRRSEATNIRLTDLDRERGILHIREGKGRVDRIVPVSAKVWEKLDEYIEGFHPVKYLFEGQTGGKYSVESVYRVFKQALHSAGIKKDVGVHSLRHSYATHLHESGLDIRYIQELLGHRNTRTTEIYTHVSRRNLRDVRSPIEDLDVR
jgi:integrase/recombinase XerD